MRARYPAAAALALLPAIAAHASETVVYSYDAKGRLTRVQHSGGPSNGTTAAYTYDPADNRSSVTVTGAPARLIMVPLSGLRLIPIS